MKRTFAMVLAMVLLVVVTVGATLAWLNDNTETVENTFTIGKVKLELKESPATRNEETGEITYGTPAEGVQNTYQMIPNTTYTKDPTVKVLEGSEKCWVFITVEKSENLDDYITYTLNSAWTELEEGVYYQEGITENTELEIITGDTIVVNDLTNTEMEALNGGSLKLNFKAYAIQAENLTTPEAAWTALGN